jgi:pimeloyl-ACP methyl ester carboxylesterase
VPVAESIALPDGRAMSFRTWGPTGPAAAGAPLLVHFHGVPGSRLELAPAADALAAGGVRVVAPDRPGIGFSSPAPGRGLAGCAADAVALADALGAERFAVSGFSAGGPYALATAAACGDRVTAVLLLSSAGDPSTPDPDRGVVLSERLLSRLAQRRPAAARLLWRGTRSVLRHRPSLLTGSLLSTAPADAAYFDAARARAVAESLLESLRQGTDAMVEDYGRCYDPWDFDPRTIRVPVTAWHGEVDQLCPMRLAEHLRDELPDATLVRLADTGHLGGLRAMADLLTAVPR